MPPAARCWEDLDRPYEAARALAEGHDEAALRTALATFDRLGATPAAAYTRSRLRTSGARGIPRGPRPSTRTNAVGLTARELDVVALLVHGSSTQQMAEHLFLSSRTIENHIASILAKLGASTRADAAARAAHLGLLPQSE